MPHKGMGSHQSARMEKDEWLTPPWLIERLGHFDVDPCAPVIRPWPTADKHYTIEDGGLYQPWRGRVWLNPPYGLQTEEWLKKLVIHKNGTALIFARTETAWFRNCVWRYATALLFIHSRLTFHHVNGDQAVHNAGAPSVLIAYDKVNAKILRGCVGFGAYVDNRYTRMT